MTNLQLQAKNINDLTQSGLLSSGRHVGSEGNWAVIMYIYNKMREFGYNITLEPVTIQHQLVHVGGLWVQKEWPNGEFRNSPANGAVYSPDGRVTGRLYSISPNSGCDLVGTNNLCDSSNFARTIFLQRLEERLFYSLVVTVHIGKKCLMLVG
jgi:hypothetical protein